MPFPPAKEHLRRSRMKASGDTAAMHRMMNDEVFPFLRSLGDDIAGETTTYGGHMHDARYTIPSANLLGKVVDMLDQIRSMTAIPTVICTSTCSRRSPPPA